MAVRAETGDEALTSPAMLGLADIDGVLRGKYVSARKLASLRGKDGGFCDCVFGWDMDDVLYEDDAVVAPPPINPRSDAPDEPGAAAPMAYTGWHTGFPDARYRLIADSERMLPDSVPYFVGEFANHDGSDHPLCPRTLLRQVLARYQRGRMSVKAGFEYELFVFKETPASARAKGYRDLTPLTPGNFGYSVLRAAAHAELFQALMRYCRDFSMPLEGLHCETGPGVWEAALEAAEGLEAADRAILFKTFGKAFFQQRDMMATFMAKWSMDYPGQSGHYHFSILESNRPYDVNLLAGGRRGMADHARWSLGGLCHYMPEFLAMLAPTVNSYARLVKGAWAPTGSAWGVDNRTTAFRFIPGRGDDATQQHIECRVGGADANPYLAAAATLGAALAGIEERLEPPPPIVGNAYEAGLPAEWRFAPTLREAALSFDASKKARELFGDAFVTHFAKSRLWEAREHERHVNSWQLGRYFEIV